MKSLLTKSKSGTNRLISLTLLGLLWAVPFSQAERELSPETKRVLSRMDQASRELSDLTAHVIETKVTLVVNDTSVQTGKLFYKLSKNNVKAKLEYDRPEAKTLLIDKGKVVIYEPRINHVREFDLGKRRDIAGFLFTGFGQSSANLRKSYDVRFLNEESLNGTKTSVLELTPRSDKVSALFAKILLWIDPTRGIPIQTRLTEVSGDYLTIQFERIELNPHLSDRIFKLNLPKGVER